MSNSSLISYTRLTKNCSKPRNQKISKITIHHMAGVMTGKSCADYFATTDRQVSSNYCIGNGGDIALSVDESNRAWTSGSSWNDNRAVTIEVSNSVNGGNYPISDAAMNSLIKLCIDICRRNGISKLYFDGTTNATLTYHYMFQSTGCPGEYIKSKTSYICDQVNAGLSGKSSGSTPATPSVSKNSDEKTIWDFLFKKIGNTYGVAGLMGNLYAESSLRSTNLQNTYETSLGYSDASYTSAVDSGKYTNFVRDNAGYGLAQWTYYIRKQNLLNFAKYKNKSIGDLEMQLEFLYEELSKDYVSVLTSLKSSKSVKAASDVVLTQFEKPKDQSDSVKSKRAGFGQVYYDRYAKSSIVREVKKDENGRWYCYTNGVKDISFTGLAKNNAGTWYCKNGLVDFSVTEVIYDKDTNAWYFVKDNLLTKGPTVQHNNSGWWYIDKDGKVDFNYNGWASNDAGRWWILDGKVDFDATEIQKTCPYNEPSEILSRAKYQYGKIYKGNEGVKWVQWQLKRKKYNVGDIDGFFGPTTENCVKALQRNAKIDIDGYVGPITRHWLKY